MTYVMECLEEFYKIRGDNFAKRYIEGFLKQVIKADIEPENYMLWYKQHRRELGRDLSKSTRYNYNVVLRQFIQYVITLDKISKIKTVEPHKTTIHDSFSDFIQSS